MKPSIYDSLPSGEYIDKKGKKHDQFFPKIGDKEFKCAYIYREETGSIFCLKLRYDNYDLNPKKRDKMFITAHRPPGDNKPWIAGLSRSSAYPLLKADSLKEDEKRAVLVVEGEKDALCSIAMGLERDFDYIVTTAGLGETKTDLSMLSRRQFVYYYPDDDLAGYKRAWNFLSVVKSAIIIRPEHSQATKKGMDLDELSEAGWTAHSFIELMETATIDPVELRELAGIEEEKRIEKEPDFVDVPNHKTAGDLLEKVWRGNVIYVENEDSYYKFDGSRWENFSDIKNAAYGILYGQILKIVKENPEKAGELLKLISRQTKGFVRDAMEFFKTQQTIYRAFVLWDGRKIDMTLTLSDGVIDFSKGKLVKRKGEKDEYRKIYLPLKTDDVIKSDRPDYFLDTMIAGVMPNRENAETLLSWISLIPTRFTEGKTGAFFIGESNTGKTTLIETLIEVFPRMTKKLPSSILLPNIKGFGNSNGATPEQADMEGKLLCYTSETEKGKKLSNNLFKELTGGEEITARELYQKAKTFKPTFQILISTNHPPKFDATDGAVYNRILPIIFEQVHEKGSENTISSDEIKRNCLKEWPAIIKFLCEKAIEIRKNKDVIPISPQFLVYKEHYRTQQKGDIDIFIEQCLDIVDGGFTPFKSMHDAYVKYFDLDEKQAMRIDSRTINAVLFQRYTHLEKKRKVAPGYNGAVNGVLGVKLKDEEAWGYDDEDSTSKFDDVIPF